MKGLDKGKDSRINASFMQTWDIRGSQPDSKRSATAAKAIPKQPEINYITVLSIGNWRTSLFFPAPSAIRAASSLARAAPC